VKIGVISDTHGFFDPQLRDLLAGVEVVLHAGDVGRREVLDELERVAPVRAVRGNTDPVQLELSPRSIFTLGDVQFELLHELPARQAEVEEWGKREPVEGTAPRRRELLLRSFDARTGVVIFGHSHQPCFAVLDGRLFLNPGSAGKRRFSLPRCCGILEISAKRVGATILSLERYNETILEQEWSPGGG
jgi:hypothetical protein